MPADRSEIVIALKVGAAGEPVDGPANIKLAFSLFKVAVSVPAEVIGEPLTENMDGIVNPTDETPAEE